MAGDTRVGRKELIDYFCCSWNTIKKHLKSINDKSIYYKTVAGKHVVVVPRYEKKYGAPSITQ